MTAGRIETERIWRWSGDMTETREKDGVVIVRESGAGRYAEEIFIANHVLRADEPVAVGGTDTGPTPHDMLLAALGACTAVTLRMYAERKKWPLERVSVRLRHERVHAEDCQTCETKEGKIDRIERDIAIEGPLDAEQKARLLEIADKCPVHRTLTSEVWIETRIV
jgi:putative redox protein